MFGVGGGGVVVVAEEEKRQQWYLSSIWGRERSDICYIVVFVNNNGSVCTIFLTRSRVSPSSCPIQHRRGQFEKTRPKAATTSYY